MKLKMLSLTDFVLLRRRQLSAHSVLLGAKETNVLQLSWLWRSISNCAAKSAKLPFSDAWRKVAKSMSQGGGQGEIAWGRLQNSHLCWVRLDVGRAGAIGVGIDGVDSRWRSKRHGEKDSRGNR